ncbi:MAG: hypothetical protein H7Y18_00730 [Clostridiaceae bacterium]|nr:hypothetical protein [Clostridiaceae bacterium]
MKVYCATCISSFGDGLDDITFALLLYSVSHSTFITSYVFATVQAVFSTISVPSKNSLSLLIMDNEFLLESKSLLNTSLQLIQVFSYALSSIFIKVVGLYTMLFIDSLTFIISGILFGKIKYSEVNVPYRKICEFKKDVIDGFVFIKNKTGIMLILILAFGGNVLMSSSEALLPAYFGTYYNKCRRKFSSKST